MKRERVNVCFFLLLFFPFFKVKCKNMSGFALVAKVLAKQPFTLFYYLISRYIYCVFISFYFGTKTTTFIQKHWTHCIEVIMDVVCDFCLALLQMSWNISVYNSLLFILMQRENDLKSSNPYHNRFSLVLHVWIIMSWAVFWLIWFK